LLRYTHRTKIIRYLLVIFQAKSTQKFRLSGKKIDNTFYFDLNDLTRVADSSGELVPHHIAAIQYNTKVAIKIYTMLSKDGLVSVKKVDGVPHVTTTDKGDDVSTKILRELIVYDN
jgi:predicted transcriptional regulator